MLVKRLIKSYNIELELKDKGSGCDILVTVFQNVLKHLFEIDNIRRITEQITGSRYKNILLDKVFITSHST